MSQSLFPLFLIVGYIFTVTLLIAWSNSQWSMDAMMRHFMAGFFLVFSFFKFWIPQGLPPPSRCTTRWPKLFQAGLGSIHTSNCSLASRT